MGHTVYIVNVKRKEINVVLTKTVILDILNLFQL